MESEQQPDERSSLIVDEQIVQTKSQSLFSNEKLKKFKDFDDLKLAGYKRQRIDVDQVIMESQDKKYQKLMDV